MAESYVYDWSREGGPYTDDPEWVGKLDYGSQNRVFLDGQDVSHLRIKRFVTGENGRIDFVLDCADGRPLLTADKGEVRELTLGGLVRFEVVEHTANDGRADVPIKVTAKTIAYGGVEDPWNEPRS